MRAYASADTKKIQYSNAHRASDGICHPLPQSSSGGGHMRRSNGGEVLTSTVIPKSMHVAAMYAHAVTHNAGFARRAVSVFAVNT